MKRLDIFWRAVALSLIVVLLSPLVLVVLFAFSSKAISNFPIAGLSLRWWREMISLDAFWDALGNSLIVGFSVGLAAAIIGTMAALGFLAMPARRAQVFIAVMALR